MKNTSTGFATIASGNSARYYTKINLNGTDKVIQLNNFKIQNIENKNNDLCLGNTCASGVSFSIYKPAFNLENEEIIVYEGIKVNKAIEYVKLGIFKITTSDSDDEYTNYTGYDRMYSKMEMSYSSSLTYPSTDKAVIEEVCSQAGISLSTEITSAHEIKEKPDGYTKREIIMYMAQLQGKNAVINADGNLELRWYKNTAYKISGNKYYEGGVTFSTSKDFTLDLLSCTNGTKDKDGNIVTLKSGTGATGISFDNPWMTQQILDEVYNSIGGFTYRPLSVKFVGDFRLDVGDIITVSKNGKDYSVPIMQITHECDGGLISTVQSIGKSDSSNTNPTTGTTSKQMQRVYAELLVVNEALIGKLSVDEAKIKYATIDELHSKYITADKLEAKYATIEELHSKYITAEKIEADYATIQELHSKYITAEKINADYAKISVLESDYATISQLDATNAVIKNLSADTADIKTLIFGSASGKEISSQFSKSVIAVIDDAVITSAMIKSLDVSKLNAGAISTNMFTIASNSGQFLLHDNTMQISDDNSIVRVQIGKDASNDYSINLWNKEGNLIFSERGITEDAIKSPIIRNDMVSDDANISAGKLDVSSLFTVINESSETIKSTRIYVDDEKQTLDFVFKTLTAYTGGGSETWGSALKQSQDFITQKLWWTDINSDGDSVNSKFSYIDQSLDSIELSVTSLTNQIEGDITVYTVSEAPTLNNYPACNWCVPIYPSATLYPDTTLVWTYTDAEYKKHLGDICYLDGSEQSWKWAKLSSGKYGWSEITNTQTAYILSKISSLEISVDGITASVSEVQRDLHTNYSTTISTKSLIDQTASSITADITSVKNTLSANYSTTETTKSLISASKTSILSSVSASYVTKTSHSTDVKTIQASLELKVDTKNLVSSINASADIISLKSNRFSLDSTYTQITSTGEITAKKLIATNAVISGTITSIDGYIGNWKIGGKSLESFVTNGPDTYGIYMGSYDGTETLDEINNRWVYSVQKNGKGMFVVHGDGDIFSNGCATFNGDIRAYGSAKFSGRLDVGNEFYVNTSVWGQCAVACTNPAQNIFFWFDANNALQIYLNGTYIGSVLG